MEKINDLNYTACESKPTGGKERRREEGVLLSPDPVRLLGEERKG